MRRYQSWPDWPTAEAALAKRFPPGVVAGLGEAYRFAAGWHGDQVRPGGEPYTEHLLETLEILIDSGVDSGAGSAAGSGTGSGAGGGADAALVAALLHDVVEDTPCPIEEVRRRFGPAVAEQVGWLTRPEPEEAGEDARSLARERYLASFAAAPVPVLAVKLSDRYSNVQRLHTHPLPGSQRGYYRETVDWFGPLSERIPFFAALFAGWAHEYRYLGDSGSDRDTAR